MLKVIYPDSDGKPMADNTKQFRWIVVIQQNLDWLFANTPDVFVAGDLLWYPVEGNNTLCTAPNVLVALDGQKAIAVPINSQQLEQAEQQLEQERQRSQALAEQLKVLGVDPTL